MNKIYIIIFIITAFSYIYTDQVFGDSTSTLGTSTLSQEEVNKLLNDEYQKTPFSGELNLYSILTILVVATVILLKFAITNTGWFGQKKSDTYKEYEKDEKSKTVNYTEWSEERINDLKAELKEQKRLLEIVQGEVNKMLVDIKSHKEISVTIKEDVKDIKDDIKEQCNTLNDLEVKIAILEKLVDRYGGGK